MKTADERWNELFRARCFDDASDIWRLRKADVLSAFLAIETETRSQVLADYAATEKKAREDEREKVALWLARNGYPGYGQLVREMAHHDKNPLIDHGTNETEIAPEKKCGACNRAEITQARMETWHPCALCGCRFQSREALDGHLCGCDRVSDAHVRSSREASSGQHSARVANEIAPAVSVLEIKLDAEARKLFDALDDGLGKVGDRLETLEAWRKKVASA